MVFGRYLVEKSRYRRYYATRLIGYSNITTPGDSTNMEIDELCFLAAAFRNMEANSTPPFT
jgi:hypothetical protein